MGATSGGPLLTSPGMPMLSAVHALIALAVTLWAQPQTRAKIRTWKHVGSPHVNEIKLDREAGAFPAELALGTMASSMYQHVVSTRSRHPPEGPDSMGSTMYSTST